MTMCLVMKRREKSVRVTNGAVEKSKEKSHAREGEGMEGRRSSNETGWID